MTFKILIQRFLLLLTLFSQNGRQFDTWFFDCIALRINVEEKEIGKHQSKLADSRSDLTTIYTGRVSDGADRDGFGVQGCPLFM